MGEACGGTQPGSEDLTQGSHHCQGPGGRHTGLHMDILAPLVSMDILAPLVSIPHLLGLPGLPGPLAAGSGHRHCGLPCHLPEGHQVWQGGRDKLFYMNFDK